MKQTLAKCCDQCKKYGVIVIRDNHPLHCPYCQKSWGTTGELTKIFDACPVCSCRQFYTSKDFNQFIGCLIMLIGIILVPFTYGLSLAVFALVDGLFYRRVSTMINCYRCGSEFRGFSNSRGFKPFLHHIGLKYDKYR